jgi:hypothetical protein
MEGILPNIAAKGITGLYYMGKETIELGPRSCRAGKPKIHNRFGGPWLKALDAGSVMRV